MKNLPDKIYLSFGEMSEERFEKEDYKELCEYSESVVFDEHKFWETDVEYTRTDAFIEKACEWLKENFLFDEAGYCKTNIYSTKSMIYSFKNTLGDKL